MWTKKLRIVLALTALLVAGFATTSVVSYIVAHDSLSEQIAETTLPLTSDNIYSEIQQDLLRPIFISSLMAQDTFVRDWVMSGEKDVASITRYLSEIQKQYGTITSFFVSEETRKYYHSSGVLKTIKEEDPLDKWYFKVKNMRDDYEVNVDIDTADKQSMVIFINYRVYDYSGRYIGATGVGLAVDAVKKLIETYQQRYGRKVYFTDRQGVVALNSTGYTGEKNIHERQGIKKIATQILSSPSGSYTYQNKGHTVYVNSRLVPEFDWYLLVEQQDDPGETRILNTLLSNLLISLFITGIVLLLANLTISSYQNRLEEMATTDQLTGIANRHMFDMLFGHALKSAKRHEGPISAIILDIDHFKYVNDTYGHAAGDAVIQRVVGAAKEQIRESYTICRWGGEEFLLLLPDCNLDHALKLAENIRDAILKLVVNFEDKDISVTASLGVTLYRDEESQIELLKRADSALYEAKKSGRNRVEFKI
ncbi:MAG: sensor domain-containing diguanylate cyclase [Rhodospirillales bacterium]|nr:sensor domain-containing diguanylate cyclase [Rhodospirillales bacterium]